MRDRLRQPNTLSHTLAVRRHFSIAGFDKTDAFERYLSQLVHSFRTEAVNRQVRFDKLAARHASRKRIELRAVTNLAKQPLRLIGRNTQQRDRSTRRPQQSRHQVHQRRLPCSVWTNKTGDAGRNLNVNSIDAEYLAVELGDVVEDDELICRCRHVYFTTSYAFTRHDSNARQTAHTRKRSEERRVGK